MRAHIAMETAVRNKRKTTMYYLTQGEKNEVIAECGANAYILYEYYLTKIISKTDLTKDKNISKALPFSEQVIQRNRLKLIAHNYFDSYSLQGHGKKVTMQFLGKEAVLAYKFFDDLFGSDLKTVNRVLKKFTHTEISDIITEAKLSQQDTNDLLTLFGIH